mmetsp:Transcript_39967/g.89629  ORF Transcript_39967/g.89629 Transcript_39967/m.89629 type:complete len:254 (-) Transcript_39967:389-1150(-)
MGGAPRPRRARRLGVLLLGRPRVQVGSRRAPPPGPPRRIGRRGGPGGGPGSGLRRERAGAGQLGHPGRDAAGGAQARGGGHRRDERQRPGVRLAGRPAEAPRRGGRVGRRARAPAEGLHGRGGPRLAVDPRAGGAAADRERAGARRHGAVAPLDALPLGALPDPPGGAPLLGRGALGPDRARKATPAALLERHLGQPHLRLRRRRRCPRGGHAVDRGAPPDREQERGGAPVPRGLDLRPHPAPSGLRDESPAA